MSSAPAVVFNVSPKNLYREERQVRSQTPGFQKRCFMAQDRANRLNLGGLCAILGGLAVRF
jgi:hypothetical protein